MAKTVMWAYEALHRAGRHRHAGKVRVALVEVDLSSDVGVRETGWSANAAIAVKCAISDATTALIAHRISTAPIGKSSIRSDERDALAS